MSAMPPQTRSPNARLAGPIAITGADGHVERALQERLADAPNEVRPLGRDDPWEAAFADADTVVHSLARFGRSRETATRKQTSRPCTPPSERSGVRLCDDWSSSATSARTDLRQRVPPNEGRSRGAGPRSARGVGGDPLDLHLRPAGQSRTKRHPIYRGGWWIRFDHRKRSTALGPVYVGDVVEALALTALDQYAPIGTFALAGPQETTVDRFVGALNRRQVREHHLMEPFTWAMSHLVPTLTPTMVGVLASDSLPDGPLIADALHLQLLPVGDLYHGALAL
jgi:hypothetical protein